MKKDSLGWLTESAFLPTESKKINVDNSSFVGMKAKILEEKAKLLQKQQKQQGDPQSFQKQVTNKKEINFKNITKDEVIKSRVTDLNKAPAPKEEEQRIDADAISFSLFEKAKKYEEKCNCGHNFVDQMGVKDQEGLVDFEEKKWNNKGREQVGSKNFLKQGEIPQVNEWDEQDTFKYKKPGQQDYFADLEQRREDWERQARDEIEGIDYTPEVKGDSASSLPSKLHVGSDKYDQYYVPLVRQKWDHTLRDDEKQKLKEVLEDKDKQKQLQMLAKRKREEDRLARKQKIEAVKRFKPS